MIHDTENSAALILLAYQHIRGSATMRYINLRLTLTLTLTRSNFLQKYYS